MSGYRIIYADPPWQYNNGDWSNIAYKIIFLYVLSPLYIY